MSALLGGPLGGLGCRAPQVAGEARARLSGQGDIGGHGPPVPRGKRSELAPCPPLAQPANAWLSARQPRRGPGLQRTHGPHVAAGSAQALRNSWASFILSFASWDWSATLTFKTDVSRDRARRMFFAWLARLGRSLEDSKAGRPARFKWVLAMEDTCAGRVHLHALLSSNGLDDHPRFRWEARWESVGGGLARILPRRAQGSSVPGEVRGEGRRHRCRRLHVTFTIERAAKLQAGDFHQVGLPEHLRQAGSTPLGTSCPSPSPALH